MSKRLQNIADKYSFILPAIVCFLLLFLWEATVKIYHIERWILPGPWEIIRAFWNAKTLIVYHTGPTLLEAFSGLLLAVIVGTGISMLMQWSLFCRKIFYPFIILSQTIPFIALAPLLTVWFGFGIIPKIIVITLVCFFPVTISLFDGFQSADREMVRLVLSMGATKWQLFRLVTLPASLPSFFSGLRVAAAYSILGAVISEWIGTDRGIGILLIRSAKSYLTDRVFATICVITLLSLLMVFLVDRLARISIPWHFHKKL